MVQLHDDVKRALESFMHGRDFHSYGCSNRKTANQRLRQDVINGLSTIGECKLIDSHAVISHFLVTREKDSVELYLIFYPKSTSKPKHNDTRYDFLSCISKLEKGSMSGGMAIFITDITAFPFKDGDTCDYEHFSLSNGREVKANMPLTWKKAKSRQRKNPIILNHSYTFNWYLNNGKTIDSVDIPKTKNPYFFYLMTEVNAPKSNPQNTK